MHILTKTMRFESKDEARSFFQKLTQTAVDWNRTPRDRGEFQEQEQALIRLAGEVTEYA
jgi:V/A-type H+-transporting ATPase subunit A